MPTWRARRLCPGAVFLPGDHGHYAEVSAAVFARFRDVTPLVEGLSLDEAFLDVTGSRRLLSDGETIAARLRARVADDLGLRCSVGVAPSKFLAKLASEAAKPRATPAAILPGRGVVVVEPGEELAFLHPLPVERLWGVGPATATRLHRLGVVTVGDLADLPEATVVKVLGRAQGHHLHRLAHADDPRPVEADRQVKSIGHEETFPVDLTDREELGRVLGRQADAVAARLRATGVRGRTVQVKLRYGDFTTLTRALTLPEPVASGPALGRAAHRLLDGLDTAPGVRLLGVSVSGLTDAAVQQLTLDDVGPDSGWDQVSEAVDEVRRRFGSSAIGPASAVGGGPVRADAPHERPWGPDRPPSEGRRSPDPAGREPPGAPRVTDRPFGAL
jgi:DNA polymerase-4